MVKIIFIKSIFTLVFMLLSSGCISQSESEEIIKVTSVKFSRFTNVKDLITSIPKDYEVQWTKYDFNDGNPESIEMNGNEIPISITQTDLINKKGMVIHMKVTYFKDNKILAKQIKVVIE